MTELLEQLRAALPPQYELERELASGGMGTVYLARDTVLNRKVAVKVHRQDLEDPNAGKRLRDEARTLARLRHPNVVSVYHGGEFGQSFYYIMDYVEGETLAERLARGPLSTPEALKLGNDLLSALEAVHELGIVHRDIKPRNIFLIGDQALLGDFGIAKHQARESGTITEPGQRVGTPGRMAPEQLTGGEVSPATDLYAVGMVLYEAVTGRNWSILTPLNEADWSGIAPPMAKVLRRALTTAPGERWPDASAYREALQRAGKNPTARVAGLAGRVLVAIAGLAVVSAGIYVVRDALMPASPAVSETRIAVLPFSVRGSGAYDYLSQGMVDLLSTKLDGAGELRSADPRAVLSLVEQEGVEVPDPGQAERIARGLGAGLYVLGNIVEVGGRLRLDASLYDPAVGLESIAQASSEGEGARFFDLVDEVAAQLLVGRTRGSRSRTARISAVTTNSLPALKAYLEGEYAFRLGQFELAAEAFQRATELDSTFALAWYRLGVAGDWLVQADLVELSAEQALRHSSRLSDHDRELFEAFFAYRNGEAVRAERLYRAILSSRPDDVEAWVQLGELLFHYGPFYGRSIGEAREPFQRVLTFEPDETHALTHLIRIAALEGEATQIDALVDRYLQLNPDDDRALEVRALKAFTIGGEESQREILSELEFADAGELLVMSWSVPIFSRDIEGGLQVVGGLTESSHPPDIRAMGHTIRAALMLARGRWTDAKVELDAAATLDAVTALEYRALLAATPFINISEAELEALRGALRDLGPEDWQPSSSPTTWASVHDQAHGHLRLYLLGLLSAGVGDHTAALRYADELARRDGPAEVTMLAGDLAHAVRAEVAISRDRPAAALAELEQAQMKTWYQSMSASSFFSQTRERYMRAGLLAAAGREREAITWYSSFEAGAERDLVFLAPSHLKRADIYASLGELESAAEHYERFIELWRDCDPELRPLVTYAAERLTMLAAREDR